MGRGIRAAIRSFHIRTPLAWAAASYALGIVFGVRARFAWWMLVAAASAPTIAWFCRRAGKSVWPALLAGCMALGFCAASLRSAVPPLPPEGPAELSGRVVSEPKVDLESATMFLAAATLDYGGQSVAVPGKIWLHYRIEDIAAEKIPAVGQRVRMPARIALPQGQRNPGGFDFRAYLLRQGAYMTAYASQPWTISGEPTHNLLSWIQYSRQLLSQRMDVLYGANAPLIRGMVIGEKDDIASEDMRAFQRSGIAHLLSVSGLHVGFVALPLLWLAGRLALRGWQRMLLVGTLLALYCALVGAPPSTLRACVMLSMLQGAPVLGRPYDSISSLAAVFWIVLLMNPLSLWDASLTLSCSAVLGISLLLPTCTKLFRRLPKKIGSALAVSLAAQLGTLPLVASYFGEIPMLGLLTNLVAVPLSGGIVMLGMAAALLDLIWTPLALPLVWVLRGLVSLLVLLSKGAASLPFATLFVPSPPWYVTAAGFAAIALIGEVLRLGKAYRKWLLASVGMAASLGLSYLLAWHGSQYVQLDVGQGDAAVLRAGGTTAVIDTGSEGTGGLVDYLCYEGLSIDALFLSHPHEDHAGALTDLMLSNIPIRRIFLPGDLKQEQLDPDTQKALMLAQQANIPFEPLRAGDALTPSPAFSVEVLSPPQGVSIKDGNDLSLVLRLEVEGVRLLTTGDVTSDVEPLRGVDADVLKVAHHGSRASGGGAFLDAASPSLALLSVGYNNYGHPSPEVLARLDARDARVLRTDLGGALMLRFDQGMIEARTFIPYEE